MKNCELFQVIGKYHGVVSFGEKVVRSKWYIVDKKNIEPLLSGPTAEKLGIIKFASTPPPPSMISRGDVARKIKYHD